MIQCRGTSSEAVYVSVQQLDTQEAVGHYRQSKRRLLVLGYNATLTTAVEAPRQPKRHFDQIKVLSRLQNASVSASVIFSREMIACLHLPVHVMH
jgi:trehalose-6-phosphatase